ncbi:hypothetical protein DFH06DRAFT_1151377 [Mycena polygramma]|nr:hypothetical protein DFH06DRAFT_1151377 [Mycena polygramma]
MQVSVLVVVAGEQAPHSRSHCAPAFGILLARLDLGYDVVRVVARIAVPLELQGLFVQRLEGRRALPLLPLRLRLQARHTMAKARHLLPLTQVLRLPNHAPPPRPVQLVGSTRALLPPVLLPPQMFFSEPLPMLLLLLLDPQSPTGGFFPGRIDGKTLRKTRCVDEGRSREHTGRHARRVEVRVHPLGFFQRPAHHPRVPPSDAVAAQDWWGGTTGTTLAGGLSTTLAGGGGSDSVSAERDVEREIGALEVDGATGDGGTREAVLRVFFGEGDVGAAGRRSLLERTAAPACHAVTRPAHVEKCGAVAPLDPVIAAFALFLQSSKRVSIPAYLEIIERSYQELYAPLLSPNLLAPARLSVGLSGCHGGRHRNKPSREPQGATELMMKPDRFGGGRQDRVSMLDDDEDPSMPALLDNPPYDAPPPEPAQTRNSRRGVFTVVSFGSSFGGGRLIPPHSSYNALAHQQTCTNPALAAPLFADLHNGEGIERHWVQAPHPPKRVQEEKDAALTVKKVPYCTTSSTFPRSPIPFTAAHRLISIAH